MLLLLVQLAHSKRIWATSHGKRTEIWNEIAAKVAAKEESKGVTVTGRACREKFDKLCAEAKVKHKTASSRSGDAENWDPIDQLLFECNELSEEYTAVTEQAKKDLEARASAVTKRQAELKEETMRTLSKRGKSKNEAREGAAASSSSSSASSDDVVEEKKEEQKERKRRVDTRSLMAQNLEQNRENMELNRQQFERHDASVRQFTETVDKRMAESNQLFALMISKMK